MTRGKAFQGQNKNTIIIGAGAAGLMAAITAAERGQSVLVLDHATRLCEKIRISGGGRCNFTNLHCDQHNFISHNPRFARAALKAYRPRDFIRFVDHHGIAWHEKAQGQLFCDHSSGDIIAMLQAECHAKNVTIRGQITIKNVESRPTQGPASPRYWLETSDGLKSCRNLIVATGGLSIPKIGASDFGYRLARSFGLRVTALRPGLVPLVLGDEDTAFCSALSGVALPVCSAIGKQSFEDALLFTHRGLSGPAILQISSYWQSGETLRLNLLPGQDVSTFFTHQHASGKKISALLSQILSNRLAKAMALKYGATGPLAETGKKTRARLTNGLHNWSLIPAGDEGYRKAEVTRGGVDTDALNPMECREKPGLFFVGEVIDVTGHLGGHNFQWAWSSGHAAGRAVD